MIPTTDRVQRVAWMFVVGIAACRPTLRAAYAAEDVAQDRGAAASATAPADEKVAPVLLLTGFQPFGANRPPNPSWEGIKPLDGKLVHGYRIVCREMKVEWGSPLAQLGEWIDELHPAAVFSFGQGRPGGFAIETRARNQRGAIADNLGAQPAEPLIAADGATEVTATIDAKRLAAALVEAGQTVELSQDAGQYLCEETLYTLEYLKSQERVAGDVLFCHVPPLGTRVGETTVDAAYVQKFVETLIAAWAGTEPTAATVAAPATTTLHQVVAAEAEPDPREAEVRALIERYFQTWNAEDIDRYGQCFMPQAAVQLLDPAGRLTTLPVRIFLDSQREAHRETPEMNETPERVEVRFEGKVARVIVYWKLVAGAKEQYGYDHFTIMPIGNQWRIANLFFYEAPREAAKP
jgi:pyroglutamyl-peptidase